MNSDSHKLTVIDGHIGRRIRLRRRLLGMNQSELAARIGVTFQQVHKYETGQSAITAHRLFAVARVFRCGIDEFYSDLDALAAAPATSTG